MSTKEKPAPALPDNAKIVSGAEAVILSLMAEGTETIFGYPGGAIMPIYDALYDYADQLNHILVRHEQGAIHAAQGFARVTGKVGVCFATSGPGATNLVTGLADAKADSTPLVCITGQVAAPLLGTDAFQEADVISITTPVTKWNIQVTDAADIPAAISKAFYLAQSGRPGPVLLDITKDAQFTKAPFSYERCTEVKHYAPKPPLSIAAAEQAADLINSAKKPLILAGQGVHLAGAHEELLALAEKADIPVATTLLGLSAIPSEHPLNVGLLGMHGNYAPNVKTNEADLIIAVGMRFDDRVTGRTDTYAKQAKVIHIDLDPAEINKIIRADVALVADAREALAALSVLAEENEHREWLQEFQVCMEKEYEKVVRHDLFPADEKMITMGEVLRFINETAEADSILVTDVGQHQMVASRYFNYRRRNSNVTSGGLGTMGFALPAAIGAKAGRPEAQVIAVIGDGGFQMNIQELGTIMQTGLAVKVIILNNNYLGMVRQWQQLFFEKRYSFVEMENPDFVKIAQGYGIRARKVERREELQAILEAVLESPHAEVLEVLVGKEDNVFPMVPTGACVSEIRLE
ncbi:biosynthetic-type acetolactate synthase large subunit [Pontibacter amylolyticus]|uniref:Acetolactate synthase n=1 Tax=Pontibacter amylolyticus TaxID=1424080 RepID=A0ABQ1WC63_9BACT|nr:biosynthetic-type acetolactate synthase large subunit [Pontibacter amylolyticus]GGG24510.1 acetolactate synthase [Pontibacter amylolyticus]